MKKIISLVLLVTLVQACSTGTNYQKDKPMNYERTNNGRFFIQDNHIVKPDQAMDALKADPKTADLAKKAEFFEVAAVATAVGAGFMIGYGGFSIRDSNTGSGLVWGGLGVFILSLFLDGEAGSKTAEAVDIRSKDFKSAEPATDKKAKGAGFSFSPSGVAWNF